MKRAALLAITFAVACNGGNAPAPAPAADHQESEDQRTARDRLEQISRRLDDVGAKLDKAISDIDAAAGESDADRAKVRAKLEQLRKEHEKERGREDPGPHMRSRDPKIDLRCVDNPLAKGCS